MSSYIGRQAANPISPRVVFEFVAAATGAATLTGNDDFGRLLSYTPGQVNVTVAGLVLDSTQFTANDGSRVLIASVLAGQRIRVEAMGVQGNVSIPSVVASLSVTGNLAVSGKLGYGAGGSVTQATSKTTSVTLNKPSGKITMNAAALAAGASVIFTLNNNLLDASSIVGTNIAGGTADAYTVQTLAVSAGSVRIRVTNISAGSLSEAVVVNFAVTNIVAA